MNANTQKKGKNARPPNLISFDWLGNFYELKPVLRRYVLFGDQNTKAPLDKKLLNKRLFQIDPPMYIHLGTRFSNFSNKIVISISLLNLT